MHQPLMMIVFLLGLLVASCRSQLGTSSQPRPRVAVFQKLPHLDDVVLKRDDHALSQAWVTSKIDCSRRCAGTKDCTMSTFQPGQEGSISPGGSCQLYGQLPNAAMEQEASPGARSYVKQGVPAEKPQCAAGYSWSCGRCLWIEEPRMECMDAIGRCRDLHRGRLLVIRTREDLDCLQKFVDSRGLMNGKLWVGANNKTKNGRYVLEDGAELSLNSPVWATFRPCNKDEYNGDTVDDSIEKTDMSKDDGDNVDGSFEKTDNSKDRDDTSVGSFEKTDNCKDPGSMEKTDNSMDPGSMEKTDNSMDPGSMEKTDNSMDPGSMEKTDNSMDPGSMEKTDNSMDPGSMEKTDNSMDPGSMENTDNSMDPGSMEKTDNSMDPGSMEKTDNSMDPGSMEKQTCLSTIFYVRKNCEILSTCELLFTEDLCCCC